MARSSWSGVLEFGLITIPVKLYRKTSPNGGVSFRQLNVATGNPISMRKVDSVTGEDVKEITKGYEVENGTLIEMSMEEVKELLPERSSKLEMLGFVNVGDVEVERLDTVYTVSVDDNFKRPYSLMTQAMAKTGKAALCKIVLSTKESLVLLRAKDSQMIAHTLHWQDEIRDYKSTHAEEVSGEELELAVQLVEKQSKELDLSSIEETFKKNVEELAYEKLHNGDAAITKPKKKKTGSKELDLLAALQMSVGE